MATNREEDRTEQNDRRSEPEGKAPKHSYKKNDTYKLNEVAVSRSDMTQTRANQL
jgi:hypothetical protein